MFEDRLEEAKSRVEKRVELAAQLVPSRAVVLL
jgi:hypothetical protein